MSLIGVKPLFSLALDMAPPVVVADGETQRRFMPIAGGAVSGGFVGKVLPGGGDWQTVNADGSFEIDAHYVLEIDGHGLVELTSRGVRNGPPEVLAALGRGESVDPSRYYFRTVMRFVTAAPGLERWNHILALSDGRREKTQVLLNVCEVT